jgi:hypothetical protein
MVFKGLKKSKSFDHIYLCKTNILLIGPCKKAGHAEVLSMVQQLPSVSQIDSVLNS